MPRVTAKICGLTTPDAVRAAVDGGASHLGFVLFDASPRRLTPGDAAALAAPARGKARIVALTVDPDDAHLGHIMTALAPDMIQLHGRETPQRVAAVRAVTGVDTIKAVGVRESSDVQASLAYQGAADHLMFDAKPPLNSERPGGHGIAFDWTLLRDLRLDRPWFLAGGLDPWTVAGAIAQSGASLVDVSSGVERGPGVKDAGLITAFLEAVRRA
jgi:phosphoribosylanthranilate isomerase